jgi:flagellin-like hook-associated protein FlgL
MNYYDEDGTSLLASETIQYKDLLGAKRTKELTFESLGVAVTLKNNSNEDIRLGEAKSGLDQEASVTQNRRASLIGDSGPKFQTGEASRNDFAADAFRDIRLGNNIDTRDGESFNTVNDLINRLTSSGDPATEDFQALENGIEGLITAITDRRSSFGVLQNRLESTLNNLSEQYENLTSAQSQIQDTDFAWETARLTRLQIGQQSSTAMLAQANAIPNVILALLE